MRPGVVRPFEYASRFTHPYACPLTCLRLPSPPRSFTVEMWARGGELFDHADIETPKTETLLSYATQQLDAGEGRGGGEHDGDAALVLNTSAAGCRSMRAWLPGDGSGGVTERGERTKGGWDGGEELGGKGAVAASIPTGAGDVRCKHRARAVVYT